MDHHKNGTEAASVRVGEERAARILERAAALDADRSSEIELDQLREAAFAAGISNEAFDQAMAEIDAGMDARPSQTKKGGGVSHSRSSVGNGGISSSDFAHFTAVLRDIMGDDGHVSLVEDRIEWQDKSGVSVSVSPTGRGTTSAVAVEGKLKSRLLAIGIPAAIMTAISILFTAAEDDLFAGMLAMFISTPVYLATAWRSHKKEQLKLRKKAESIRRQLQRLLVTESHHDDSASRIARLLPRNDRTA
jgi:hypothetical protein